MQISRDQFFLKTDKHLSCNDSPSPGLREIQTESVYIIMENTTYFNTADRKELFDKREIIREIYAMNAFEGSGSLLAIEYAWRKGSEKTPKMASEK